MPSAKEMPTRVGHLFTAATGAYLNQLVACGDGQVVGDKVEHDSVI